MSIKTLIETMIASALVTASVVSTGTVALGCGDDFESITEDMEATESKENFQRFHDRMDEVRRQGDKIPPLEPEQVQHLIDMTKIVNELEGL